MSVPSRPERLLSLLLAFQSCFHAPSSRTFQGLVVGWIHCLERHTVTGVVVAAGLVGVRHISVGSRFFARAQWSLDAVGQVVFHLALRWLPDDQPLDLLGDDPLTRRQGNCVSLASMQHDPLLSSGRKRCFRFGHVWVVLALWVPLPMSQQRGFALPILVRLSTGAKRGGTWDARSRPTTGKRLRVAEQAHAERDQRTKLERLRELVGLLAAWAVPRTTPAAIVVDDLVLLWFAAHGAAAGPAWVARPWSRRKATPSFLDLLTAVRHAGSQAPIVAPPFPARLPQKSRQPTVPKRKAAA